MTPSPQIPCSRRQTAEQLSPLRRFPSSHSSGSSRRLLAQNDGGREDAEVADGTMMESKKELLLLEAELKLFEVEDWELEDWELLEVEEVEVEAEAEIPDELFEVEDWELLEVEELEAELPDELFEVEEKVRLMRPAEERDEVEDEELEEDEFDEELLEEVDDDLDELLPEDLEELLLLFEEDDLLDLEEPEQVFDLSSQGQKRFVVVTVAAGEVLAPPWGKVAVPVLVISVPNAQLAFGFTEKEIMAVGI